ncbi:MAG: hypothetical protein R3E11_04525 [Sphingobium sp.]|nr:hypothetical protein [Sphingobium sp.]MCP5398759.1 hypothetical protein [Sphingomonas sp.]
MSFIFSKLAFFRRGNSADPGVSIRRSDAHPDAPARRPVFASTELGPDALPPVDAALEASDDAQPMVKDITGLSMPRAPEPMPWDMIQEEMDRLVAHARERAQAFAEKSVADSPVAASLSDLADRLELGLARRRDAVAAQAGLSQSDADATAEDMAEKSVSLPHGEKLDEALAALRGIAARGA